MSENLNKILGQLEEDLKKLQSAKEQVESVVASNQEFAIAANNLIVNTESLLSKIEVATEGTIGQFSQKLELSKDAIDKIVKDGIGRLDSNIEKIEFANQKAVETTGYAKEELIGKNPRVLKSGETTDSEYVELWNNLSQGNEWKMFFHNKRKNGELYWEEATIFPISVFNCKWFTAPITAHSALLAEFLFLEFKVFRSGAHTLAISGVNW